MEAWRGDSPIESALLPTTPAARSQPHFLLARREAVKRLARRANATDAILIQYHPYFWNYHGRSGEDLFPLFMDLVSRPVVAVVHESAPPLAESAPGGSWLPRTLKRWNVRLFERLNRCPSDLPPGWALRKCCAIVVHAPELRDWLINIGVDSERIDYRPHPVAPQTLPSWTREEVDHRFSLHGKRVIVVVGFPDPRKGFDIAVAALLRLPPDVVLVWVGGVRGESDRIQAVELRRQAQSLGIAERFIATGFLEEGAMTAVLRRASVGWAPFRVATGSGSIGRLLAPGLPTVASDVPSIRDVRDFGAGIELVPPGRDEELAAATNRLLADPDHAAQLSSWSEAYCKQQTFGALARRLTMVLKGPSGTAGDRCIGLANDRILTRPNRILQPKMEDLSNA
jgi:glycosyltransferase involved in cell wall biosynthesis